MVANRHLELLLYSRMPAARQAELFGAGLTITWPEIPADLQQLYRRVTDRIQEQNPEAFNSLRIFMRSENDRLRIDREWPTDSAHDPMELILPAEPADDLRALIGRPMPDLQIEQPSGKTAILQPRGPLLLYITPAWPRPVVACQECFDDLRVLQTLDSARVQILGTEATAAELREWWKERGLAPSPPALLPESVRALGTRHQPLAIVVGRDGRVTWVREGYSPGDEAEWRRQLDWATR